MLAERYETQTPAATPRESREPSATGSCVSVPQGQTVPVQEMQIEWAREASSVHPRSPATGVSLTDVSLTTSSTLLHLRDEARRAHRSEMDSKICYEIGRIRQQISEDSIPRSCSRSPRSNRLRDSCALHKDGSGTGVCSLKDE